MSIVDSLLAAWLRWGRYPWSRLRRRLFEWRYRSTTLPSPDSLEQIPPLLSQVQWTMDGPLHLYDSVSLPERVWAKKRDDCDGFAVLAAALLLSYDPATKPSLVTVMLRPARKSHTVCVFKDGDGLRTFDNRRLREEVCETHGQVVEMLKDERGDRLVCWDVVDPESLKIVEFHRAATH